MVKCLTWGTLLLLLVSVVVLSVNMHWAQADQQLTTQSNVTLSAQNKSLVDDVKMYKDSCAILLHENDSLRFVGTIIYNALQASQEPLSLQTINWIHSLGSDGGLAGKCSSPSSKSSATNQMVKFK